MIDEPKRNAIVQYRPPIIDIGMRTRRIRFAPVVHWELDSIGAPAGETSTASSTISPPSSSLSEPRGRQGRKIRTTAKSRRGCRECKRRRVKCDETFPVCLRCQRSGAVCCPMPRLDQWQFEVPGIASTGPQINQSVIRHGSHVNRKLLQTWLQTTSRMMVLDPDWNPLSLPLLHHCASSTSLVHAVQSIAAGYQEFFRTPQLVLSLEERSKAFAALRSELATGQVSLIACFLTAFLLGLSSTYIDGQIFDFGKEHYFGARHLLLSILSDESLSTETTGFLIGAFVYWDMTCSALFDPLGTLLLDDSPIYQHAWEMATNHHPITGLCTSLFSLLGNIGRHCRAVVELHAQDPVAELQYEETLLSWRADQPDALWELTADAFRSHGLIMLYRICGRHPEFEAGGQMSSDVETEALIREYALSVITNFAQIPVTSDFVSLQPMPLMTAGAELRKDDLDLRNWVVARFRALFSFNRLPASLHAVKLLEELWELRDKGETTSWLELMLLKNWRLRLG